MIKSSYALKFGGPSRESLPTRERGYALYTECLFTNDVMPDGSRADRNYVTLADWYLANLNALYAAPIDYPLWNRLNDRSPLASRLYEFLLFSFSAGIDTFTINYPKLCHFLPATVETYASQAKEQLGPALRLLADAGVIGSAEWATGRSGEPQLQVTRGGQLTVAATPVLEAATPADVFETITTQEGKNPLSPAERLVRQFHTAWSGGPGRPASPGELDAARECVSVYGFDVATQLLPRVVKRMRAEFPDAKTFGAARSYFAEVHAEHLKRKSVLEQAKAAHLASQLDTEEERLRSARHDQLEAVWHALSATEREAIETSLIAANPQLRLSELPRMLHRLCLDELDRRASPDRQPDGAPVAERSGSGRSVGSR